MSGGAGSAGGSKLSESKAIERKFVPANAFGRVSVSGAITVPINPNKNRQHFDVAVERFRAGRGFNGKESA